MSSFDVVVCGLGVMGSAALRELSRRGLRVLGIDRFAPGHDRGSSHGATRVIRLDYFEHPSYVPLLRRAYELWHELEQSSDYRARPEPTRAFNAKSPILKKGIALTPVKFGISFTLIPLNQAGAPTGSDSPSASTPRTSPRCAPPSGRS